MRRIFSALVMVIAFVVSYGQNNNQQIIDKINAAASKLSTMQCDFVQTKSVKLLNDKIVSKGKMYYSQPNKLRWEYITPYTYTFILNDNKVALKKNNKNSVIDVNQNKMFREIVNIMMNSVVGKCLTDKKSFKTTVKDASSEWIATLLTGRSGRIAVISSIEAYVYKDCSSLRQKAIGDSAGGYV